ncbi:MAG: hypothetical protein CYPHOPRED_001888, partial [Cyphobasidiales sp. Tagirdzhanova-0007]
MRPVRVDDSKCSDPPYFLFGTSKSALAWHPLDSDLPPQEGVAMFNDRVSGHYSHGPHKYTDASKLEYRTPDPALQSTIASLSEKDAQSMLDPRPAIGSDEILRKNGIRLQPWPAQVDNAFFG